MKIAIIQFPGSNCERETILAVQRACMEPIPFLWNEPLEKLLACDGCVIVGGFSYEDRGRAGIIASLDPIIPILAQMGEQGRPILGICNGAQILVESGLVPGIINNEVVVALAANKRVKDGKILGTGFYNDWVHIKTKMDHPRNAFLNSMSPNQPICIPTAHGEGRFILAEGLYETIQRRNVGMMQYCDRNGNIRDEFPINPNGSERQIAALCNISGNIMAIMPHPERTTNGDVIFKSMARYIAEHKPIISSPLLFKSPVISIQPYQPPQNVLQLTVELIITDNTAASIQKALQNLGVQVDLKRQIHWEIVYDEDNLYLNYENEPQKPQETDPLDILKQKIIESGELFNTNKECLVKVSHSNTTASFLIRDKEDLIGQYKCEVLKKNFGIKSISAIKRGVLLHITPKAGDLENTVNAIMDSHILFNPFAHACYTFPPPKSTNPHIDQIKAAIDYCVVDTHLTGKKHTGKVRDIYDQEDQLVIVTTDRLSAFDRILAAIPFKGQVLNQISAWWFEQIKYIVPSHLISVPNANTMIVKKCKVFPIEFVVRAYITGSTETSLWTHYARGERKYCGHILPDGLRKNQRLPQILLTPTTKNDEHDELLSAEEIIKRNLMTYDDWQQVSQIALQIFTFASELVAKRGLILVDTKYEFGKDSNGNILIVDELHTPDSSRYWKASHYEERFANDQQPDNFDKEFVRLWYREHCDPYHDKVLPKAPPELIIKASERYIEMYELITGNRFV